MKTFAIHGGIQVGQGKPLLIIGGPCVIETQKMCLEIGEALRDRCKELGLGYVFKASFDKANRSSVESKRGPGVEEGLRILGNVRKKLGVAVTTDVHETGQVAAVGKVVDLIQIPAFLCRQTDLLVAAAKTGKPVNVKKGQFLSPGEMVNVVKKLEEAKAPGIMLTERGTFFGYNRLVNDFIGLADMMELGYPVCFDVTHSTQQPGGEGKTSGGRPERAPLLAKLAVTAGVAALFIEAHPEPGKAMSDAAVMMELGDAVKMLGELKN